LSSYRPNTPKTTILPKLPRTKPGERGPPGNLNLIFRVATEKQKNEKLLCKAYADPAAVPTKRAAVARKPVLQAGWQAAR